MHFICSIPVINSVELPLDADVQTSNLLITFLKYSSIVMQDTKGKHSPLRALEAGGGR